MNINIEDLIKQQVEEMDIRGIVKEIIREQITPTAKQEIKEFTKKRVGEMINIEIEEALSKGVSTDDGWGKKESFESFEAMFKIEFKRRLSEEYSIKRTIQGVIEQKVKTLFNEKTKEIQDEIANKYLAVLK